MHSQSPPARWGLDLAATAQAECLLGLDLGVVELKVALSTHSAPVQKSRVAVRGRSLVSLLEFRFDHFLSRAASGVINAAGINCAVDTAAADVAVSRSR